MHLTYRITAGSLKYSRHFYAFLLGLIFIVIIFSKTGFSDPRLSLGFFGFGFSLCMLIAFRKQFYIELVDQKLIINDKGKQTIVKPEQVHEILLHNTIMDKLLGVRHVFIKFDNPKGEEEITTRAFGFSVIHNRTALYPGIHGHYVSIPDKTEAEVVELIKKLRTFTGKEVPLTYLGPGTPYYRVHTTLGYWLNLVLMLVLVILLLALGGFAFFLYFLAPT